MKASSVADPTWSQHKLDLGAEEPAVVIPKLLADQDESPGL